jgi:hypothetical protein
MLTLLFTIGLLSITPSLEADGTEKDIIWNGGFPDT